MLQFFPGPIGIDGSTTRLLSPSLIRHTLERSSILSR